MAKIIERLQEIHEDLKCREQDDNDDLEDLLVEELCKYLSSSNKTVQSLLAMNFADVLRLSAPNCPYNEKQLVSIFKLMINQLKLIQNLSGKLILLIIKVIIIKIVFIY
jgi:sister-chromatid-cohesion protein PDS5